MPTYELEYFDLGGRADTIRLLLYAAGIDFKDTRIPFAEWPAKKPTTPLGNVPVLKIDGTDYCQSLALITYAAKIAGWYPEDPLDALKCDEVANSISEVISTSPRSKDPVELKKLREEFQSGFMTKVAQLLEKRIQANGGLYVVGKSPTFADLMVSMMVDLLKTGYMDHFDVNFFDDYPGIMATAHAINDNETVKAYRKLMAEKK